uniref:Cytochrome P450 n=2 Tax=Tetranychus urticae TaxID=32264 RepID=T1L2V2_TETUR
MPNFPFTDNMENATRNLYEAIDKNIKHNQDGSLSVFWLSVIPVVLISDHEAVRIVNNKTNLKKPYLYKLIDFGTGLLTSKPDIWKVRRKLIEPFFATKKLKGFVKVMNEEVTSFTEQLNGEIGKPVNLESQIHYSTLNIILKVVTSLPLKDSFLVKKAAVEIINEKTEYVIKRGANPFYWFDWIFRFFQFGRTYFKNKEDGEKLLSYALHRRKQLSLSNEPEDQDLIHLLECKVDEKGVFDEFITMIGAGHDTVAVALRWILFNLGNHLDKQERVYQELVDLFPDDTPVDDLDRINQCQYLEQFIKESLRLNPSVHGTAKVLEEDVTIRDKKLLKGSYVWTIISSTHRDPSVYPDPDKFDPERWTPENASKIPQGAFIPFGYGPRSCIGSRYAMAKLKIYTIQIVRKFSLKSTRKTESIPVKFEVTLKPVLPLEIILTPRNGNNNQS